VRLLVNAAENYPAWLDAIERASRTIYFETYLMHDDSVGQRFADAFGAAARRGVRIYLLYDWLGGIRTRGRFWKRLVEAGVHVRSFNRPRLDNISGLVNRDHRKLLVIDDALAYVGGLGIGDPWLGNQARRFEPWRDTGVEIRGPAAVDLAASFLGNWQYAGGSPLTVVRTVEEVGDARVRVIPTAPAEAGLYRLDTLIASAAREFLWLTDAYFVATNGYVRALAAAARDGVDVRLLLPGTSDLPLVRALSVIGYRPLLEAGVRIFEWNGTMLHAKTAVADGAWTRIGSSNLNPVSWWGNWELDVAIEDDSFATQVADMFLRDLRHSTEIVLDPRHRVVRTRPSARSSRRSRRRQAARAMAGAVGLSSTVGAALTNRRALTPTEARVLAGGGVLFFALAALAVEYPRAVAWPLAVVMFWIALTVWVRAARLYRRADGRTSMSRIDQEE
jgi:cardiolipin synthase